MFKTLRDKITLSGTVVLMIGVGLLIFTFASAYLFLTSELSIFTSGDLIRTFGDSLAPLIVTSIHIMYLGIMGWIGSILTIRGVTILSQARQTTVVPEEAETKMLKEKAKQTRREEKPEKVEKPESQTRKPEVKPPESKPKEIKPYEPAIVVLTAEPQQRAEREPQQPQEEEKQSS